MATRYELWRKSDVGSRTGTLIDGPFYVIDTGMEAAKKASKGTYTSQIWNNKIKSPYGSGSYESIELPNTVVLIERGDKQSSFKGFGIAGKWFPAVDCKRCAGSGQDVNNYGLICGSCSGAGFKTKV